MGGKGSYRLSSPLQDYFLGHPLPDGVSGVHTFHIADRAALKVLWTAKDTAHEGELDLHDSGSLTALLVQMRFSCS